MSKPASESRDPRIRRTRKLLQDSLYKLMESKGFDQISVRDIAETATVNRATFYDHYADKFALLECSVAARFDELLAERQVRFDGSCVSALTALVLAVCDFLAQIQACHVRGGLPFPHQMEAAIIAVVRGSLLGGVEKDGGANAPPPEMIASAASWAIYGAAREWSQIPARTSPESAAASIAALVTPLLRLSAAPAPTPAPS